MLSLEQQLNPEQIEAVTHGEGPQLVLAGAGTGKTRVITHRIAWLISAQEVEPYRIAAVTFTNKAAAEMRERVAKLAPGAGREVFVGTFHGFSLRLLRRYGERVGLTKGFSILDSRDQQEVMKRAIEELKLDPSVFQPRQVLSRISAAKNRLVGPTQFDREAVGFFDQRVADAYRVYQRSLRESGGVDFDDMIGLAVRLLRDEVELGDRMRQRLRYLLVDEYQDTNFAQLQLIETINGVGGNLTAVGDEDQSIYLWRGAELGNILEFERSFPGACVRKLERNYRSTQLILDAAGGLVEHNRLRRGKRLWTDRTEGEPIELYRARDEGDEAAWITRRLIELEGEHRYRQMAVLVRTNAQTRAIEDELLRRKVPYCLIAGVRFYDRAEIKDLVSYLRLLRNPQDNLALRRVLNKPPRGIGKATQDALFREAEEMGQSLWDVLRLDRFGGVGARASKALRTFRELILGLAAESARRSLPELLELVLERTGYQQIFPAHDPESESRLENVREFLSAAQEFAEDFGSEQPALATVDLTGEGEPGSDPGDLGLGPGLESDPLTAFLDYVALVSDSDSLDSDLGVAVMTLHSAKGLEFPVVFVAGLEQGLLPHFNSQAEEQTEEERRLLYVGMTRACRRLFLSACRRRRIAGRYQDQDESMFLGEIPERFVTTIDSPALYDNERNAGVYNFFGRERAQREASEAPTLRAAAPRAAEVDAATIAGARIAGATMRPGTAVLERGKGVRHPLLGVGVILDIEGEGDNAKLTVFFDRAGKRRLIAKYAALDPL